MEKKIDGIIFGQPMVDLRLKTNALEDVKLVEDLTKRRFIRAIGVIGIGAFLFSLIPKKAQAIVFGSGQKTRDNADILDDLALESGGNLASVKTNTDKLDVNLSTVAKETTLGTVHGHVESIDNKTPALGQALAAASVPVILPALTVTALTPPAAITGFATETTLSALNTKIPASPATEGGNLADVKTNTGKITDALAQYKFSDEDSGTPPAGTVYRGYLDKDGNWFIVKEVVGASTRTYRYAKGTSAYTTSWGNRSTSVSYDYFDVIF